MGPCIFYLLTLCLSWSVYAETCTENSYQTYLGSKTAYRVVANNTFGRIDYTGCTPLKIWMIVRHGTRNPSKSFIESMENRLPQIRDIILENNPTSTEVLHNSDLIAFKKWENKLSPKDKKKLAHEGENEMVNIAERMQSRFPTLLSNVYSNTSFKFKYTDSQRTKKSAYYFAIGLFGKNTAKSVWYPEPSKKDPILRFYKLCNKWRQDVKHNPDSLAYRKEFQVSPLMKKTVQDINKRLKLNDNQLNFEDIHLMYSTCAFETAWKMNVKSPWCSAFTLDNLKVMEYYEDLKYFWYDSYGNAINHKQACVAFEDIVSFFNSKSVYPKSKVYFTHSGTLLKILSYLELFKDVQPLTGRNFNEKTERNFRVSRVAPFGTNLAMVLYDCAGVPKVLTLHQEHIIRLPTCPSSDLCELNRILDYYQGSSDTCDFDEMCKNYDEESERMESTDDDDI